MALASLGKPAAGGSTVRLSPGSNPGFGLQNFVGRPCAPLYVYAVARTLTCPELAALPLSPCCKNALPRLVPALELSAGMASRAGGPLRSGMIRYMYYFGPLFGAKVVPGNTQNEIGIIDNHFSLMFLVRCNTDFNSGSTADHMKIPWSNLIHGID